MSDYRDRIGKSEKEQTGGPLGGIGDFVEDTADTVTDTAEDAADEVTNTVNNVTGDDGDDDEEENNSGGVAGFVNRGVDNLVGDAEDAVEDTTSGFTAGITSLGGGAEDLGEDVADFAGGVDIGGGIEDTVGDFASDVGGLADGIGDTAGSVVDDAGDFLGSGAIPDPGKAIGDLTGEAGGVVDDLAGGADDIASGVGNFLGDTTDAVAGVGDFLGGDIDEAIGRTFDDKEGGGLIDGFNETVGDIGGGAGDLFGDAVGGLGDVAGDVFGGVVSAAVNLPGGGGSSDSQWQEPSKIGTEGQAVIVRQKTADGSKARYFAFGKNDSGKLIAFGNNNKAVVVKDAGGLGAVPSFGSEANARAAAPSVDEDKREDAEQDGETWASPEKAGEAGNAVILSQRSQSGKVRYFAITKDESGTTVAITPSGGTLSLKDRDTFDGVPSYDTLQEAKRTAESFFGVNEDSEETDREDANRGGDGGEDSSGEGSDDSSQPQWKEPSEVGTIGKVKLMRQRSTSGETRFFAITVTSDGKTVALKSASSGVKVSGAGSFGELPSFSSRSKAESVAKGYNESRSDSGGSGGSGTGSSGGGSGGQAPAGILSNKKVLAAGGILGVGALAMATGGDDSSAGRRVQVNRRQTRDKTSSKKNSGSSGGKDSSGGK